MFQSNKYKCKKGISLFIPAKPLKNGVCGKDLFQILDKEYTLRKQSLPVPKKVQLKQVKEASDYTVDEYNKLLATSGGSDKKSKPALIDVKSENKGVGFELLKTLKNKKK
jgi:hypothetical protein